MRILTPKEMKSAEVNAFNKYCTETELMKKAGESCAEIILKSFGADMKGKNIAIICGNGKNAGDGFVIAICLNNAGIKCRVVIADKEPVLDDPVKYYTYVKKAGIDVLHIESFYYDSDYIIDCIFGTGFHGDVKEPFNAVIKNINSSDAYKIAIDVPSGVNSETGEVSLAIKADFTIAVSDYKYSHVLPPANSYCGKTVVANIGIPDDCYTECKCNTITKRQVKSFFTKRDKNSNKGSNGRLLNISGSFLMPGAAVISSKAALKSGVGLLECAFPKSIYSVMTSHLIQPIFSPLCENDKKTISIGALSSIQERMSLANAVLIGCGIANNDDTQVIVSEVVKNSEIPIIIDADGLNSLKVNLNNLKQSKSDIIITPHPGEMARLIDKSVEYVQSNRINVAKDFANEYNVIVVLKGANTVITNGNNVFINLTGNPGLAMGGTGDMLAGIIGAFLAQKMNPFHAAIAGVYIHGLCGDITANEISERGMIIEDMLELLGSLMSEFE